MYRHLLRVRLNLDLIESEKSLSLCYYACLFYLMQLLGRFLVICYIEHHTKRRMR